MPVFDLINQHLPSRIWKCRNSVGSMIIIEAGNKSRDEEYDMLKGDIYFRIECCEWSFFLRKIRIAHSESTAQEIDFICGLMLDSHILSVEEVIPFKKLSLFMDNDIEIVMSELAEFYGSDAELLVGAIKDLHWGYNPVRGFQWE